MTKLEEKNVQFTVSTKEFQALKIKCIKDGVTLKDYVKRLVLTDLGRGK